MKTITVQKIYSDLRDSLDIDLLTGLPEDDVVLEASDLHRPGMALMGFMANFLPGRIQVIGESEMEYLDTLDYAGQQAALTRLRELQSPAVFITHGHPVSESILAAARSEGIPVFGTSMPTVEFMRALSEHLHRIFAPRTEIHASLVDVYGVGMLFTGKSGIGKSECSLDLVERGHRLVADDIVEVVKRGDEVIVGRFREVLQHNIEIRGVGVIDVQAIYGIRGIRMQKRIEVEVQLQPWSDDADYERTGLEREYSEILGVKVPRIVVPIVPGKNLTVIAEVIALDFMLKIYGVDAARDLNRRIMESLQSGDRLRRYLRHDNE